MDYYQKYLKYKSKYIQLKNYQTGGASNPDLSLGRAENKELQDIVRGEMILDSRNTKKFDDIDISIYDTIIDHLMKKKEHNEINIDLLNLLSAFPLGPYKEPSPFDIVKDESDVGFKFKKDLRYKIDSVVAEPGTTGGGDYIFRLARKDVVGNGEEQPDTDDKGYPKFLILKLFDLTSSDYKNYSPLNINEIYPNGQVHPISSDERYSSNDERTFSKISLDHNYDQFFIEEERGTRVYLSCGLDNYQNEIIQNLIIKNILKDTEYKHNLIKFYNFFYNQINFGGLLPSIKSYGCILMEEIETTLFNLLKREPEEIEDEGFVEEFKKYLGSLAYLKSNIYRFTHTDLKSQNVFIRKDKTLLIADLDKSSITFNKIRFFNNKFLSKTFDFSKYVLFFNQFDNTDDKLLKFNDSFIREGLFPQIEFEELIFRYNHYPMIPFFDFLSLFCDMNILTLSKGRDYLNTFSQNFDNYNASGIRIMALTDVINRSLIGVDLTDFGQIVFNTMIANKVEIPKKIKNIENDRVIADLPETIKLHTGSTIFVSRTKLALTPPLTIVSQTISNLRMGGTVYSTEWKCKDPNSERSEYFILYTGNYKKTDYDSKNIIKVNRYSSALSGGALFEFMEI